MTRAIALAGVLLLSMASPATASPAEASVQEMGAAFGKCVFAIAALVYVVSKLR